MSSDAAIYVRISRDKSGEGAGTERQEEDCRNLAEQLGRVVSKVYADNDISAYSGKKRPGYEALIADIEAGRVSCVLCWHTDRLHRSMSELERFIDLVIEKEVEVRTVQGGELDLSTSNGRMVARILGSVARQESEHKGERVSRARQQQARDGKWNGGRRCYGYEADGIAVREMEATEVRGMADAVVAGVSLRAVVKDLTLRNVPSTTGGLWTTSVVRGLLLSPRIAGLSSYKGEVVGTAVWPALIGEDLWRGAVAILSDPSRRTNNVGAQVKWLGSGLYRCGVCGSSDVRVGVVEGRRRYRCRNRPPGGPRVHVGRDAGKLDSYVEALIIARLSQNDFLKSLPPPGGEIDLIQLQSEKSALAHRLDQLANAFADGSISLAQLTTGTKKLRDSLEAIDSQLAESAQHDIFTDFHLSQDIGAMWSGMSLDRKRLILAALMTVTINSTKPGRAGDGTYFRTEDIGIEWTDHSLLAAASS